MNKEKMLKEINTLKNKYSKKYSKNWKIMKLMQRCKYEGKILFSYASGLKGNMYFKKQNGHGRKLPLVLQLPITNRCNLLCKMCNVPRISKEDITLDEFKKALSDKLFSEIISVGVNGGEPFLLSNIEEYIRVILNLPKIKSINIISNGILTERILEKLEIINKECKSKGVRVGVTFSLDGYRDVHNMIRGVPNAFDKTVKTIKSIQADKERYCSSIGIICTVSNYNINSINELLAFAELNDLPNINFQLAVAHKRLDNYNIVDNFSVITDDYNKMLAKEFFFGQYMKTQKSNYYFIYKFLESDCTKRMIACQWADRDVTLNASGELFYCAVNSKQIGSIKNGSLYNAFFDKHNIEYRKKLVCESCNKCIHYSTDKMYVSSFRDLAKYSKQRSTWFYNYLIKGRKL